MTIFHTSLQLIGLVSLARFAWLVFRTAWIYCIRSSSLLKYRHASQGSWALITGASDGIGIELARELICKGFNVFIHGRNENKLRGIKYDLQKTSSDRSVEIIVADASSLDVDFEAIARKIQSTPGKLTIVINNVGGIFTAQKMLKIDENSRNAIDDMIAVNARFPTQLTAALIPLLKVNQPSLIYNHGSAIGVFGMPYIGIYSATKAYVHNISLALKEEFDSELVRRVEVLCSVTGNTMSSGNSTELDAMTITSEACAKAMLARVGCGEVLVIPHWRHKMIAVLLNAVPELLFRTASNGVMKDRRAKEQDALKKAG